MHFYQSLMLLCFLCLIHATHKHSPKGLTIHSPKQLDLCRCGVQAHYDWAPVKRVQPSLETGLFPSWLRMTWSLQPEPCEEYNGWLRLSVYVPYPVKRLHLARTGSHPKKCLITLSQFDFKFEGHCLNQASLENEGA